MNVVSSQLNAAAPVSPNRGRARETSPHALATGVAIVVLWLLISRAIDVVGMFTGANLHLMLLLVSVSLIAAMLNGGIAMAIRTPVVMLFTAFTAWLMVTTATSQWKGGSFATLVNYWAVAYLLTIILISLISTLGQCRQAFYALALSLPMMVATSVLFSAVDRYGRSSVEFGTLSNPNDLAFSLLLVAPFAIYVIRREGLMNWKSIVLVLGLAGTLFRIAQSGSRSAIVAMAICFLIVFIASSARAKVGLAAAAFVLLIGALALLPTTLLSRYATLFSGTTVTGNLTVEQRSAIESAAAREQLFEESLTEMLRHPIFGVGPGIFTAARAEEDKAEGKRPNWHEVHNSFTQIGSEAGIPALLLYLAVVIYTLKRILSIYGRSRRDPKLAEIRKMAAALAMSVVVYIICGWFGTYSYAIYFPALAALVQTFDFRVKQQIRQAAVSARPAPAMTPAAALGLGMVPAKIAAPRVPKHVRTRRFSENRM